MDICFKGYILRLDLKPLIVCDSLTDTGKVFQILGAYDEKAHIHSWDIQ